MTARFLTHCHVVYLPEWDDWRQKRALAAPLHYDSALLAAEVVIPAGFVFDGESRPTAGPATGPECNAAGAVHDFGYQRHVFVTVTGDEIAAPKWLVDLVYQEALRAYGIDEFYVDQRYRMVDFYGKGSYDDGPFRFRLLDLAAIPAPPCLPAPAPEPPREPEAHESA